MSNSSRKTSRKAGNATTVSRPALTMAKPYAISRRTAAVALIVAALFYAFLANFHTFLRSGFGVAHGHRALHAAAP